MYPDVGINNYINFNIYTLKSLLSNYTELRNLTLEYVLYLQGRNTNIRSKIKRTELWDNNGMEVMKPIDYDKGKETIIPESYNQMELADYIKGFPSVKKLERKRTK